ncbi:MAG: tetraacyldisaccharide 4'-kinase [Candidatus Omnitrophica bacterium]|nr:tetraacyldisaccharide 4'-kinase [Candidatus Omnitrophota bacterium]
MVRYRVRNYIYKVITDKKYSFIANLIKFIFLVISFVYLFFIKLILFLYDKNLCKRKSFDAKVVSIGNITWGGTGKTPLVESITRYFRTQGNRVVILSRGYGGHKYFKLPTDEILLLSHKLADIPIVVDSNRKRGINKALQEYHADIVILDDGFQQWGIKKDLEIVVIDGINPFGNGWLIPRGILREPISSLKRADFFVINKTDLVKEKSSLDRLKYELERINHRAQIFNAIYLPQFLQNLANGEKKDLSIIKGKDVCIFSGIASPQSFKFTVEKLGGNIKLVFEFLDHYCYKEPDLLKIFSSCIGNGVKILLTTEKDAVRLTPLLEIIKKYSNTLHLFSLAVEMKILESEIFYGRLSTLHNG